MCAVAIGSRAEVGSSISSTSGSTASRREMQILCCCSGESDSAEAFSRSLSVSHRPVCRRAFSTRSSRSPSDKPWIFGP